MAQNNPNGKVVQCSLCYDQKDIVTGKWITPSAEQRREIYSKQGIIYPSSGLCPPCCVGVYREQGFEEKEIEEALIRAFGSGEYKKGLTSKGLEFISFADIPLEVRINGAKVECKVCKNHLYLGTHVWYTPTDSERREEGFQRKKTKKGLCPDCNFIGLQREGLHLDELENMIHRIYATQKRIFKNP